MGIYIEGVNLPELSDYSKRNNTPEVYNLHGAIVVYPDGKVELKSYSGTFEGTYDVISVLQHGDLIEKHDVFKLIWAFPNVDRQLPVKFMDALYDLPTIIPAEEGET